MNFIKNNSNEDGIVLISSMLFLMIVTILALSSLNSPKIEKMVSANEKFVGYARELANMGVLEARNWLLVNHSDNLLPDNKNNGYIEIKIDGNSTLTYSGRTGHNTNSLRIGSNDLGSYEWGITRLSMTELKLDDFANSFGTRYTEGIKDNFSTPGTVEEGWDASLDQDKAILNYFYIMSKGKTAETNPITAYSEGVVGYIQVVPSLN